MRQLAVYAACLLVAFPIVAWLTPYDDTDPPDGRSGMRLYTDHRTGCQYLSAGWPSVLTPRLNPDGSPVCERK